MHWDICIDRRHLSGRISHYKLTLCHSSATETTLLTAILCFLHRHVFFDGQSTKTIVVLPPYILLCLFLDNLARWYWKEKNADTLTHYHAMCKLDLLREQQECFYWTVQCESVSVGRGQDYFKETCCRFYFEQNDFLHRQIIVCVLVDVHWLFCSNDSMKLLQ